MEDRPSVRRPDCEGCRKPDPLQTSDCSQGLAPYPPPLAGEGGEERRTRFAGALASVVEGDAHDKHIDEIDGGMHAGWRHRRLASASDRRI